MDFQLLTKNEVAERTRITRRFLDKQIAAGVGPEVVHIGRCVRVRSDAFARWIDGLTAQSQRQAASAEIEAAPMAPSPAPAACEVAPL